MTARYCSTSDEDGDFRQVHLLRAGQVEQQIEWAIEAFEVKDEGIGRFSHGRRSPLPSHKGRREK